MKPKSVPSDTLKNQYLVLRFQKQSFIGVCLQSKRNSGR